MTIKYKFNHIMIASYLIAISGCTISSGDGSESDRGSRDLQTNAQLSASPVHTYAAKLVTQILSNNSNIPKNSYIAVGTFMPATGSATMQDIALGNQLQESVNTIMTQAGFKLEEFKLRKAIKVNTDHDQFLSRESADLNTGLHAEYLLVGTTNYLEKSTQVNARLVSADDRRVISAATIYIPNNVSWSSTKVQTRDGQLFRGQY